MQTILKKNFFKKLYILKTKIFFKKLQPVITIF